MRKKLSKTLIAVVALAFLAFSIFAYGLGNCGLPILVILSLLSGASLMSGFFLGFLFGVPKYKESKSTASNYHINNNLTEISDWLTKIIVGIGLSQLTNIPSAIMSIGELVGAYVVPSCIAFRHPVTIVTNSSVIYFGVFGIYYGYNYARLVLSKNYKQADDKLTLPPQIERVVEEAIGIYDATAKRFSYIKHIRTLQGLKNESSLSLENTSSIHQLEDTLLIAMRKMENGMERDRNKTDEEKDPQKDQWGGLSVSNFRRLEAFVMPMKENKSVFEVNLSVESTDPVNEPFKEGDVVLFALHNTYNYPYKVVMVEDGKAHLKLFVYGAFTVGALVFEEKRLTQLEFDLTQIKSAPKKFIER